MSANWIGLTPHEEAARNRREQQRDRTAKCRSRMSEEAKAKAVTKAIEGMRKRRALEKKEDKEEERKRAFIRMRTCVFFLILHVVLLSTVFMLYHSAVVKDICPPVTVCAPCAPCAPAPVCAPCPPVPVYKPCATIEAWQVHITPNTSEPTCDACPPPMEETVCDECAPVVQCPKDNKHYDTCATLWAEAGY
jgi:hypothetical protein